MSVVFVAESRLFVSLPLQPLVRREKHLEESVPSLQDLISPLNLLRRYQPAFPSRSHSHSRPH